MADAASPSASAPPLRKTALHAAHVALGARMVPFGGWDMPVEYAGITAEHLAVRERVGLFDVSHMGEIEIAGADALAAVQKLTSNDASRLAVGQIQYSALPTPEGTVVDDVLVYRWAPEHFLLVVNAGNIEKDWGWIQAHIAGVGDAVAVNSSSRYALIAIQGPKAESVLQPLTGVEPGRPRSTTGSRTASSPASAAPCRAPATPARTASRSSCAPGQAERLWKALLEAGQPAGIVPAGLGARDTLRLEAVDAPLRQRHGRDDDRCSRPASAGSSAGRRPISSARRRSRRRRRRASRKLVGFEMIDRGIARARLSDVYVDGVEAGMVTSGTQTPFLKKAIGMAYVPGRGRRSRARPSRSTSAAGASRPRSCRCRSTSDHQGADMYPADLKYTKDHEWIRSRRRRSRRSASPTTRSSSSATSCSSSCRRSAAPSPRARSSAPSSR